MRQVRLDRSLTQEQRSGDLPVRSSVRHECSDAPLGRRKSLRPRTSSYSHELGARPLRPASCAASFEDGDGFFDRGSSGDALTRTTPDDTEREKCACPTQRVAHGGMLRSGGLEEFRRSWDIAARRRHEPATTRHVRKHNGAS